MIQGLFFPGAYLPPRHNPALPLTTRFPSHKLGYLSVGPGGVSSAVIKTSKGGISVEKVEEHEGAESSGIAAAFTSLKKRVGGGSKIPIILHYGDTSFSEIRENTSCTNQEDFITRLRNDPQRILGSEEDHHEFSGILQPSTGSGLILGVKTQVIHEIRDVAKSHGFDVVRESMPHLSMLNVMLADPRVLDRSHYPLVIDQGILVGVYSSESGWSNSRLLRFGGFANPERFFHDMSADFNGMGITKLLVAASSVNAGVKPVGILQQNGFEVAEFSIGSLPNNHLFPYVSALF